MTRQRPCERCGEPAIVSRIDKLQTTYCPGCKHKTLKHIVRKGAGG